MADDFHDAPEEFGLDDTEDDIEYPDEDIEDLEDDDFEDGDDLSDDSEDLE